jgi:hypothetical protein
VHDHAEDVEDHVGSEDADCWPHDCRLSKRDFLNREYQHTRTLLGYPAWRIGHRMYFCDAGPEVDSDYRVGRARPDISGVADVPSGKARPPAAFGYLASGEPPLSCLANHAK